MTLLDNLEKIKEVDKEKVAQLIKELPQQLKEAWLKKDKIKLDVDVRKIKNIVLLGMGCDRLAGKLVKQLVTHKCLLPIEVISDYQIPQYINEETLTIFLSYSGNTLEVLESFKLAQKKKPKIFAISGGGQLNKIIKKYQLPNYQFQGRGPSRANLGHLLGPLLVLLLNLNLIKIKEKEFNSFINLLNNFNKLLWPEEKTEKNVAKYLAYQILGRVPFIIGAEHLAPVAQRWKKEFNENSKTFAFADEMPEFFHNTIEGIKFPLQVLDEIFFIFLESNRYQEKIKKALKIFKGILQEKKICFESIPVAGDNLLSQTLTGVLLGDWTSFYLAILNNIDPTPVENIEMIRRKLKNS